MTSIFFGDDMDDDFALNSDELLLNELDRRDGIYSFIFHEIEIGPTVTPTSTPIPTSPPATNAQRDFQEDDEEDETGTFINKSFSLNNQVTVFISEPFIEPEETLDENGILNINDEIYVINSESNIESTTSLSTITSLSLTSAFSTFTTTFTSTSMSTPTSMSTSPSPSPSTSMSMSTSTSTSTSASTSTLSLTPSSTSLLMDISKDHNRNVLSNNNNKLLKPLGGHLMNGKSSNQYMSTLQPNVTTTTTTSVMYDYPSVCDYMTPGKFRLRVSVPGFSHITTPLVRNRRHPLKDLPEYKNAMRYKKGQAPDLRHLFPYDPDVHAPFIKSSINVKANVNNGN